CEFNRCPLFTVSDPFPNRSRSNSTAIISELLAIHAWDSKDEVKPPPPYVRSLFSVAAVLLAVATAGRQPYTVSYSQIARAIAFISNLIRLTGRSLGVEKAGRSKAMKKAIMVMTT